MDIILHLLVGINLDDDDISKNYDEVYNELNTLFTSSMSLFDDSSMKSVELGENPSMAHGVIPFAIFSPFACYTKQDSEENELLVG
jgi:hypothetical protein